MNLAKNLFMFDTLAFSKKLKDAGVPEKQAEAQAEAIKEVLSDQMVTKGDLNLFKNDFDLFKKDVADKFDQVRKEFDQVRKEFKSEIKQSELSLKIWMGSIAAACVTIMAVLIKIL